jgi:hypothetical protein
MRNPQKDTLIDNTDLETLRKMEIIMRHWEMNRKLDSFFWNPERGAVVKDKLEEFTANFYDLIRRLRKVENVPLKRIS